MLALEGVGLHKDDWSFEANLTIPGGARVAVIGPSGAGKSTLLAVVAGFETPDRGRVTWEETDLAPLAPGDRPISILFQDQNLFPHLTAADNVGLGISPALRLSEHDRSRVSAALADVGLAGKERRRPAQLSGGEQGRVALARISLRARPILLLDEPFSALGPALRAEMLDLVRKLADETGATLLFVTHDPQEARALATHLLLVEDGRCSSPVAAEALLADPPEAFRRYLGTPQAARAAAVGPPAAGST